MMTALGVRTQVRAYLVDCLAYGLEPSLETAMKVVWHGGGKREREGRPLVEEAYRAEAAAMPEARARMKVLGSKETGDDGHGMAQGSLL